MKSDTAPKRIYSLKLVVNNRKLDEIAIDPHYEEKHPYMDDEKIIEIAKFLNNKKFIPTNRKRQWEYFETDIFYQTKNYRFVWCLEDEKNYLGIIHYYRKRKYDQKK